MVCWATNVFSAPGVEASAVKVAPIPGMEVRNGGIVGAGAVSLGKGVSVRVGWDSSVEVGTTVATSCGSGVADGT